MKLCVISGDGVGQEVVPAAVAVLQRLLPDLQLAPAEAGWDCFQRRGNALPDDTKATIRECGAAIFGAVSSPSRKVDGYRSPIVQMRREFDLYANLRPTLGLGTANVPNVPIDLLIVRENTQGLYIQREYMRDDEAVAERVITAAASERIGSIAFEMAAQRGKRLTIVHKANILPLTDGLFRDSVRRVGADFPDVQISEMLVDTAAMNLAGNPAQFDVIVTTNLFGDILSDVAAVWGGGMGVAPALNIGAEVAIAEPVHGSAPDIAGKGIANPAGALLAAALLMRHHWKLEVLATKLERAVYAAISGDARTPDLGGTATTQNVIDAVLRNLDAA
ncbi:MAG: isocitrate/isopropylmalate family dehydrogenase [Chloroflexi bacterium]|nr:isocitrate/isopropylmalate family dehydrogenase [Chloroflexota bacterium]